MRKPLLIAIILFFTIWNTFGQKVEEPFKSIEQRTISSLVRSFYQGECNTFQTRIVSIFIIFDSTGRAEHVAFPNLDSCFISNPEKLGLEIVSRINNLDLDLTAMGDAYILGVINFYSSSSPSKTLIDTLGHKNGNKTQIFSEQLHPIGINKLFNKNALDMISNKRLIHAFSAGIDGFGMEY
jgi:hypothetical protein